MITFSKTDNAERSITYLSRVYSHIVVDIRHHVPSPIKVRLNDVKTKKWYIRKHELNSSEDQMLTWKKQGGILLNYHHNSYLEQPVPVEYYAHLFIECPLNKKDIEKSIINCTNDVVIYVPPVFNPWERHMKQAMNCSPKKLAGRIAALEEVIQFVDPLPAHQWSLKDLPPRK